LLFRLGVRFPWVNRAEFRGWVPTVNLRRLTAIEAGGSNPLAHSPEPGERLEPGDLLVVETHNPPRSHVLAVASPCELRPGEMHTAEYGQFSVYAGRASGALCDRKLLGAPIAVGARRVDSVLRLADVLAEARSSGLLSTPDTLEEYASRKNRCRTLELAHPAMSGDDVGIVQRATGAVDDYLFGNKTRQAVEAFQRSHGLVVDGVVGPKTWAAIG